MQKVLAKYLASTSELKTSFNELLNMAGNDEAVAIVDDNKAAAYLVPSKLYEKLLDLADDYLLARETKRALKAGGKTILVENIDEF